MRLFTTGAEELAVSALWDETALGISNGYPGVWQPPGYYTSSNGPPGLAFPPRTGRGMYLLDANMYLRNDFGVDTSHTELFWGFAMRVPSLGTSEFFVAYTDDPGAYSNRLALRLTAGGAVELARSGTAIVSSANDIISVDQWHYFEVWFKPLNSDGRAVVYVDGVKVIDFTGDTTNEEEYINAWQLSGVEVSNSRIHTAFDDIVCNDPSGSVNNTFPGMVRLMPIRPHADGTHTDWTRAAVDLGSGAAQARNGSFDFTLLQTADADDLVTFDPEVPDLPAGATIKNIVISALGRVESGAGVIAPMVIANATQDISADQTLGPSWSYHTHVWDVNPEDSLAWEEADLSLLEIGVSS